MVEKLIMNRYSGFTLLELLIYILFFSFITMASATWMARLWQDCVQRSKKQKSLINLYTAHDILIRDISGAPIDKSQWKEIKDDCIIWHTQKGDIGWLQEEDKLVRIEGSYISKKKQWSKKTKNIIAKPIQTVQFELTGDTQVNSVSFTISDEITSVENIVSPLCKALPWKAEKT